MENPSRKELKELLKNAKTIAVVGLSDRPDRTSYQIAKAMQQEGYRIIPINPNIKESLGEQSYASLLDVKEPIDIVNVFRRSEFLPNLAKQVVNTNTTVFWAQQGVVNEEAYNYLKKHNITVIMNVCIKVAHSVLLGK
ncbi:CoA-binding protein [Aquibacillus albus]|uniref:CoA-binding protein n=1 Tax=Aquibacillus albus TaxID=1168171 RepID=A0ABS2N1Y6_9BACI|nr:CoA-binding protein [Aquibacillus albus]MBM7572143.1 putative CoA-binding protein [Aquibacillus albus]